MPALIDLRRRIKSVRNTQQITQAMKTVATVKFKKAQRIVLESRPFWHSYPELLTIVAAYSGERHSPFFVRRQEKKISGVVLTSDKGLAGAFNSNLLEKASEFLKEKSRESEIRLMLIGKKAVSHFKKFSFPVDRQFAGEAGKMSEEELQDLADHLIRLFIFQRTDAVYMAYNEFKSILSPTVTITKLLPIDVQKKVPEEDDISGAWPQDWEPKQDVLLASLVPAYIKSQILHFYHESSAAEHAARMMAMDLATKNAEDLIEDLTLFLNKIRQASITKELLEIMTAVEALGKK